MKTKIHAECRGDINDYELNGYRETLTTKDIPALAEFGPNTYITRIENDFHEKQQIPQVTAFCLRDNDLGPRYVLLEQEGERLMDGDVRGDSTLYIRNSKTKLRVANANNSVTVTIEMEE